MSVHEIALSHGQHFCGFAGEKPAIGAHFIGFRIDLHTGVALFRIMECLPILRVFMTGTRAAPCVVELGRAQGAGPNECKTNSVPLEGAYASDFAVPLRPSTGFGGFAGGFVTPYHALLPEFALSAASVRSTRRCSLLKPMVVTRA
jgi:hypothetical protein